MIDSFFNIFGNLPIRDNSVLIKPKLILIDNKERAPPPPYKGREGYPPLPLERGGYSILRSNHFTLKNLFVNEIEHMMFNLIILEVTRKFLFPNVFLFFTIQKASFS